MQRLSLDTATIEKILQVLSALPYGQVAALIDEIRRNARMHPDSGTPREADA